MKKYVNILDLALPCLYGSWDLEKCFLRLQPVSEMSLSGIFGEIFEKHEGICGKYEGIYGKYEGHMKEYVGNLKEYDMKRSFLFSLARKL